MSGETNDGGPAFPHTEESQDGLNGELTLTYSVGGMTLLDWFAGKALANSVIANSNLDETATALVCYSQAQAMIKERTRINATNT